MVSTETPTTHRTDEPYRVSVGEYITFREQGFLVVTGLVSLDDVPPAGFQLANFFAGKDTSRGAVPMTVRDMDGDNLADLVTASGQGEAARVLVYRGATILTNALPDADQVLDLFGNGVLGNGVYVG